MNYSEVKKELKKEFENLLKPQGYKSESSSQGCTFESIHNDCEYIIGFAVSNYNPIYYTGCYIQINFNRIEYIKKMILGDEGGTAIGCNMDYYFNELNYRYKIKTQEDIVEWGKIIRKFYEEYAVPFFEKYNSVAAIDKLLNENPSEKVIYCDDLAWRIIKGLIAAKLNNNPKYNELRDYYKSKLGNEITWQVLIDECMKVIDFLDKYTSEELKQIAESEN